MWERYAVVFEDIWGASAFKGATGPCTFATDIGFHVENHRVWIRTLNEYQAKFQSFRGLAITGWQRLVPMHLQQTLHIIFLKVFSYFREIYTIS